MSLMLQAIGRSIFQIFARVFGAKAQKYHIERRCALMTDNELYEVLRKQGYGEHIGEAGEYCQHFFLHLNSDEEYCVFCGMVRARYSLRLQ
jgi:hypothetical protein